jgi:1-acyl-sn-glycerol-3-phosphate acyltransferase
MWPTTAAVLFLLLVLAAPLGAVVWGLMNSRMSPAQCVLWGLAYLLVKFLWRTRWEGNLPLEEGRGAVIVCNHRSSVDPFFIQTATGRKIHWMVAREYCEHPAFAWFLKTCEVIPVGRGGIDTAATKAALRIVQRGGIIGMFPEGRINMTDALLLPARPGAAHIALRAGVPLIPCYIQGSPYRRVAWSPLLMAAQVVVRFGPLVESRQPADPGEQPVLAPDLIVRCLREVAKLAGETDLDPQLAGRQWKPTAEELDAATSGSNPSPPHDGGGLD